jgi:quercetin dioxygenase-like cupin family protein
MNKKIGQMILLCLIPAAAIAEEPKVKTIVTRELSDVPGREVTMLLVEYGPGASDPVHRHNADAMVYVLKGTVVMQVKGGEPVTLTPGQTFYEGPDDVHVVGRNASDTEPASYIVFILKGKGAPLLLPAN